MENIQCPSCGSPNVEQIDANRYQCPYCGEIFSAHQVAARRQPQYVQQPNELEDKPKAGTVAIIISFLIPIVGLILYFVKKKDVINPNVYLTAAIIGFVIGFILQLMAS